MKDKIFIDTNLFVYAFLDSDKNKADREKHDMAKSFFESFGFDTDVVISTQVCSEYYSALLKNKISDIEIQDSLKAIIHSTTIVPIADITILKCIDIKNRYKFSYWDSLIAASAIEYNCTVLYSEDMQDGLLIDNRLTIVNPFKKK